MTFNFKQHSQMTALCVASAITLATTAYAANGGLSNWDMQSHPSGKNNQGNNNRGNNNQGPGNNNGNNNNQGPGSTASPIKHVIVLIGENRGLDHTFGVYKPKGKGETISNLLSKGIVNEDGTPGPNFAQAQQFAVTPQPSYYIGAPAISKSPYNALNPMPQPNTNGAPSAQSA